MVTSKLQILSNGYMNSTKSCMLIFDSNRYLINCGEGTSRIISSYNLKPSKLNNILLTRFDLKSTWGLNGATIDLDEFQQLITIHSVHNFKLDSPDSPRKYFFEKKLNLKQHDYVKYPVYKDANVSIQKIDMHDSVCSYFFIINKPDPTVITSKLSKYDVEPGPWIKDLIKGIDYKLPNGEIIKSSEVLDFSKSFDKKVLFLDCASENCFEMIKTSELINQNDMVMIVHLADSHILNNQIYLNWIKDYKNPNCIHLFLDENFSNIDLIKIYENQAKLNLVNNEIFKLLPAQLNSFKNVINQDKLKEKEIQKSLKIVQGQTNMIFSLKPEFNLNLDIVNNIDNSKFHKKILDFYENDVKIKIDGIDSNEEAALNKIKDKIKMFNEDEQIRNSKPNSYPSILFLGTASALASTTRNLSSILISLNESANIILDCGENTIGQINRYFGNDQFDIELIKTKLVFLSHNHLDHYNGIFSFIFNRMKSFEKFNLPYEKLNILYPRTLRNFFNISYLFFNNKFHELVNLIPNDVFLATPSSEFQKEKKKFMTQENISKIEKIKSDLGFKSLETVLVKHIHSSFGISFEFNTNLNNAGTDSVFKIVYSGDCRPTNKLIDVGKNCDLLIHECTFDNANLDEAIKKLHSTISEALDVTKQMNAKYTVLTHFSAKYGNLPQIEDIDLKNVGLAFDFMKITPNDLHYLNDILMELKVAYKEHSDFNNKKRAKKLKL